MKEKKKQQTISCRNYSRCRYSCSICKYTCPDKFKYVSSKISSTDSGINMHLVKPWTAIVSWLIKWKSNLSNKIKQDFFQAVAVLILLYVYITWMLTKHKEKKLDENYTRMLHAVLNKSRKKVPTRQQLYSPPSYQKQSKSDEHDI